MSAPHPRLPSLFVAAAVCAVAIVGVSAIWAGFSLVTRSQCSWMAPIAALDAALLLRLASWPPGRWRVAFVLAVTVLTIVVANFLVASAQIGLTMGMRPVHAVPLMSVELAAFYTRAHTGWIEAGWYALALVLGWRAAR